MKIVIVSGEVHCMASDPAMEIVRELGRVTMTRASDVEWDETSQEWVATTRGGQEIARGGSRTEVIAREVRVLEGRL